MHGNTNTSTIVVLEDDPIVRLAMMAYFEAQGSEVLVGTTGLEVAALLAMKRLRPTLIVADYHLGSTTALDEVPEIMAALSADAMVVVTTGDTSPDTRTLVEACGWHLLTKPYRPEDLLFIITAACVNRETKSSENGGP